MINTKYERNICMMLSILFGLTGSVVIDYGMFQLTGGFVLLFSFIFFMAGMFNWIETDKETK